MGFAEKFADAKIAGASNKEAAIVAGFSRSYAHNVGSKLARRQEVVDELIRKGAMHPNEAVGKMSVGVLVEKLADYENISNRELAPYVQMGLQTGKKIGAGSVQQVPLSQTNIQINISPMEQALIRQVLEEIQQENPGRTIIIQEVNDEIQQAGAGGEVEATSPGDCVVGGEGVVDVE